MPASRLLKDESWYHREYLSGTYRFPKGPPELINGAAVYPASRYDPEVGMAYISSCRCGSCKPITLQEVTKQNIGEVTERADQWTIDLYRVIPLRRWP